MALPHHNLVVWQRADDLFIEVHLLTRECFPAIERYELGSQVRRAAFSVPSNIVEGIARKGERESINFFNIASASLSELGYGLHAASRLGYIDRAKLDRLEQQIRMVSAPLRGLIRRYRTEGAIVKVAPVVIAILVTWFLRTLTALPTRLHVPRTYRRPLRTSEATAPTEGLAGTTLGGRR